MSVSSDLHARMRRPVGTVTTWVMWLLICAAPAVLIFGALGPGLCDPLAVYSLQHDDFEYVGRSLTLRRALDNFFFPHATHIVPAWRLLTWGLVVCAGRLSALPVVLAVVSYGVLVAVMQATGLLIARETGRTSAGLLAAAAVGVSAQMMPVATWYAACQILWAGLGILATLLWLQSWGVRGGPWRLAAAAVAAVVGGGSGQSDSWPALSAPSSSGWTAIVDAVARPSFPWLPARSRSSLPWQPEAGKSMPVKTSTGCRCARCSARCTECCTQPRQSPNT